MEGFLKITAALNDPTRVMILRFLHHYGESCVCELEHAFDMLQSRLSRHLKILTEAGFLRVERKGKWAYYALRELEGFSACALEAVAELELFLPPKVEACEIKGKETP